MYKIIIILLCLFSALSSDAQTRPDKNKVQKQKQEMTKRLRNNTRQFEQNKTETAKKLKELTIVEEEIAEITNDIENKKKSIDSLGTIILNVQDTINELDGRIKNLSDKYASALAHQQKSTNRQSTINYLFASENVAQAIRRYRALKQFAKWRSKKAGEIESVKIKLADRQNELINLKTKQSEVLSILDKNKTELNIKQNKNQAIIESLKKKGNEIKAVIDDNQREIKKLDQELERLIAEEQARIAEEQRREEARKKAEEAQKLEQEKLLRQQENKNVVSKKKNSENKKSSKKTVTKISEIPKTAEYHAAGTVNNITSRSSNQLSAGFLQSKGNLPFPVDGKHLIVRGFGRQKHPSLPMIETDNPGIDISVTHGESARVVYEGVVSAIFKQPGYNNVVMVRHGDYLTIYANLENIIVKKGDRIAAGHPLGKIALDEDDVKQRSILHFEIRHEKNKENPVLWLK